MPLVEKRGSGHLAYEIRKAFELQREILESPAHYDEIGRRYGVKLLWPVLLVHTRLLRVAMGFCPTDERDQGLVYLLENAVLSGLADDIGGTEVVEQWRGLVCNPADILERVESRTGLFLQWSKADRRAGLGQLLASLDPMFAFWYERDPGAWRSGISPERFDEISQLGELSSPGGKGGKAPDNRMHDDQAVPVPGQGQTGCKYTSLCYSSECYRNDAVRIFKTKWVARFVRRERIDDHGLKEAIERTDRRRSGRRLDQAAGRASRPGPVRRVPHDRGVSN